MIACRTIRIISLLLLFSLSAKSQTPVVMASQNQLSYTESFADIANWTFGANGVFTAGTGASCWKGNGTQANGTIPDGQKITSSTFAFTNGSSGGVQKGTGSMVLLSTGSTDNTSAVAMDFYADFTGVNAGILSFDWATVNNSTGDRKASVRVYTSTDGTNYTELTGAQVLNFTNNSPTSGSITNVSLPSSFNNNANARIRFYFYNGTGGTIGSRPKFNLDNLTLTALSTGPCTTPATQPSNLLFSNIGSSSAQGSFTHASGGADKYLVLLSSSPQLTSNPVNGTNYPTGSNIDDATVLQYADSLNINLTGLNASTLYYVFVFAANDLCTGGPLYNVSNPLLGYFNTASGLSPCVTPANQPTALTFSNITTNSFSGSFQPASGADQYLVVMRKSNSLTANPVNTVTYNPGDSIGGGVVISADASTSFLQDSMSAATTFYYFIFSINSQNCTNGPVYNTTTPLSSNVTTLAITNTCVTPVAQPTSLILTGDNSSITGSFNASGTADSYLVLISTSSSLTQMPVNNTNYALGTTIGNSTVVYSGSSNSFYQSSLQSSTTYHLFVFASNAICNGGTKYLTGSPLTSSFTTTGSLTYNYYYGNLHAHSGYSDGNKDNPTYTPGDDYAYAKNSLSMDFLGISEHNHSGAGMRLADWAPGVAQANAATTSTFVGLYGQEWGVISNGGHVLIYGIDSLIGWESGNYQIYVPQSDYISNTGLFRRLNQSPNAFATYAHPGGTDYDNVYGIAYNSRVDSAVAGCAVESGPAMSTATTYNDYPSSMGYLSYYTKMLSKGYHLGPLMDHDTHYTNFGRANENRLVILAPSLTKANLLAAMKARRFYATQDMDTRVSLTVNNQVMGSITSGNTAPVINITANDPTAPSTATKSIKLMYGIAGSGVNATQLSSSTTGTLTYTHSSLAVGSNVYYYADITINGKRSITAPVWYTKTNTPASPSASLSSIASLTEANLNNATISVTLTSETFKNYTSGNLNIATSNISLINAPTGISVSSFTATSSTTANLVLAFNGTDFDQNSNLSVSLSASILTSGIALTSGSISVSAFVEQVTVGSVTGFGLVQMNMISSEKSYSVSASQLTSALNITAPTGYQISLTAGSGFGSSLTLNPNASGTIAATTIRTRFAPTTLNVFNENIVHTTSGATTQNVAVSGTSFITATACDSYFWNGTVYTTSGDKTFTSMVNGIDSTATLRLTIKNSTQSTQSATACNSYTWNGTTYTTSGAKTYVTTNVAGCDSTAVLNLTIKASSQSTQSATACNSYTWNGTTYTTSGAKTYVTTNVAGCDSTAVLNLTINQCPLSMQIRCFIEGLYIGNGQMQPLLYDLGISNASTQVDSLIIDLWDTAHLTNTNPDYTIKGILNWDGWVNVTIPGNYYNKTMYLALRNKSTIETWSSLPIKLMDVNSYDFTSILNAAYSDGINPPVKFLESGKYAIYSGDVNQDGAIDVLDIINAELDASEFAFGYNSTDCTGDGVTDLLDMIEVEVNASKFIYFARPY